MADGLRLTPPSGAEIRSFVGGVLSLTVTVVYPLVTSIKVPPGITFDWWVVAFLTLLAVALDTEWLLRARRYERLFAFITLLLAIANAVGMADIYSRLLVNR